MHIDRPIILCLASAFLLAGCGSSGSTSSQPTAAAASSAAGGAKSSQVTCDLVPASLVNSALGTDLGAPTQTIAGNATACEFKGAKAGAVEIRIQTDDNAAIFATERKTFDTTGQPTKDYAGFGDEAYTNIKHMPLGMPDMNTLVARQGSVEILVSSTASIAAERALEQQVFATVK
jgi:hypothetical protein